MAVTVCRFPVFRPSVVSRTVLRSFTVARRWAIQGSNTTVSYGQPAFLKPPQHLWVDLAPRSRHTPRGSKAFGDVRRAGFRASNSALSARATAG